MTRFRASLYLLVIVSMSVTLLATERTDAFTSVPAPQLWGQRFDVVPLARTISESFGTRGELRVEATETQDGLLRVMVVNEAHEILFESRWPWLEQEKTPSVVWRYLVGGEFVSHSAQARENDLPSLETMVGAAKEIVRRIAGRSVVQGDDGKFRPEPDDSWGCDIPSWLGGRAIECSPVGNCCDTHDGCYAMNSCSALSWLYGYFSPACYVCNAVVVACITGPDPGLSTGLPSLCCALGNCGQERCPGDSWNEPNCTMVDFAWHISDPLVQDPNSGGGGGGWPGSPYETGYSIWYSNTSCCYYDFQGVKHCDMTGSVCTP